MKVQLNNYEITEALSEYLKKRGITTEETDCYEMSFSTTVTKHQVKKHKNGKPVMVKHQNNRCYPQYEEVSRKTVWHGFFEENNLAIWID